MISHDASSAIIVGAGIAGLSAAIALRQAGFTVSVYERAAAIEPMGAALSLWSNAVDALAQLGVDARIKAEAAPILRMGVFGKNGRTIIGPRTVSDTPYAGATAYLPTRSLLQSTLQEELNGARLCLNMPVAHVEQDSLGVTVRFENGEVQHANIAIIADGIWSKAAAEIIGTVPRHAGYGGVLALSDPMEPDGYEGCAHEYWGDCQRFGVFDVGSNRRYWFYMRNEAAPHEATLLKHSEIARYAEGWPSEIGRAVAATRIDRLIPFSIHAKPPPQRLGVGRIICVGDAAHAMEPNLGQGACQAIEDAVALGAAVKMSTLDTILPNYEKARLARIEAYVRRSAEGSRGAHSKSAFERQLIQSVIGAMPNFVTNNMIARMHRLPNYSLSVGRN